MTPSPTRRPTEGEVNALAAQACGEHIELPRFCGHCGMDFAERGPVAVCTECGEETQAHGRNYVGDKNTLPPLLLAVRDAGKAVEFARELHVYDESGEEWLTVWRAVTLEAAQVVDAALRALSLWPSDWESLT